MSASAPATSARITSRSSPSSSVSISLAASRSSVRCAQLAGPPRRSARARCSAGPPPGSGSGRRSASGSPRRASTSWYSRSRSRSRSSIAREATAADGSTVDPGVAPTSRTLRATSPSSRRSDGTGSAQVRQSPSRGTSSAGRARRSARARVTGGRRARGRRGAGGRPGRGRRGRRRRRGRGRGRRRPSRRRRPSSPSASTPTAMATAGSRRLGRGTAGGAGRSSAQADAAGIARPAWPAASARARAG